MRFVILSRSRFLFTTRRLVAAAKLKGHDVRVAAPADCSLLVTGGQPRLLHRGRLPSSAEAIIPRLTPEDFEHGIAVLRALERMGVPVLNPSDSLALTRDRFSCAMALAGLDLPVAATALVPRAESLDAAVDNLGGLPLLLRPLHQGRGRPVLLEQDAALEAIAAMAWQQGGQFVLQRLTRGTRELRVFVAGTDVLGAVLRRPMIGRGTRAGGPVEAPPALAKLAVRAAKGTGLAVAAVDFIEAPDGPVITEVDGAPNLRGLAKPVREAVLKAVIRQCERLGVSRIPV